METPTKHSEVEIKTKPDAILVTKEGLVALKEAISRARAERDTKALQIGQVATDGDRDYHENFTLRDLQLELQGPIARKILDLETQERRAIIGDGIGNFDRQFSARIETPNEVAEDRTIRLVGPIEINCIGHSGPNNELYLSYESPLGKVLLRADLVQGNTLEFKAPNGIGKITIEKA